MRLVIIVLLALLTAGVIITRSVKQKNQSTMVQNQLSDLITQNDSLLKRDSTLSFHISNIDARNDTLSAILRPFADIAAKRYPNLNEKAQFDSLLYSISMQVTGVEKTLDGMQPGIKFVDSVSGYYIEGPNKFRHQFVFRAKLPSPLRGIVIRLGFDGVLDSASYYISGIFVIDNNSILNYQSGRSDLTYSTDFLGANSDVVLSVWSRKPLLIVDMKLAP